MTDHRNPQLLISVGSRGVSIYRVDGLLDDFSISVDQQAANPEEK